MANGRSKWWLVPFALAFLSSACGSGGDDTIPAADEATPEDAAIADADSSDNGSEETSAEETASNQPDPEDPGSEAVATDLDCAEVNRSMDTAGDLASGNMILEAWARGAAVNPQQQFEEGRAQMLALKAHAPEIADDIDRVIAGLDVIADVYSEIGWDTDFASDPAAATHLWRTAFTNPAFSQMMTALPAIGVWFASACG